MIKYSLFALSFIVLTFVAFAGQTDRDAGRPGLRLPSQPGDRVVKETEKKKRIREGTTFKEKRCIFRVAGQRVLVFSEDESERFLCLENLNLERVMQVVLENPAQQVWKVDGIYTEYQGENFVLLQRAVLAPPK